MRRALGAALAVAVGVVAACSSGGGDGEVAETTSPAPTSTVVPATVSAPDGSAPTSMPSQPGPTPDELAMSGGEGTVFDTSATAFALPLRDLSILDRRAFAVGNNFFNDNWVTAPASTEGRDGLGPTFNAQSCSSCHFHDGRAEPPESVDDPELGLLLRLSVPGPDGTPQPVPAYGDQLQDRAINGVPAEATVHLTYTDVAGHFVDGTPYTLQTPTYELVDPAFGPLPAGLQVSPRLAPPVFGVGLLEAVPEDVVLEGADADDADGDGISGRPNHVVDVATGGTSLGRFGWKANVPTVEQQVAGAFHGDIGITTSLFPEQNCPPEQTACLAAPNGGTPEVDDIKLDRVTFYTRTLAVPARRDVGAPDTTAGEQVFTELGCSSCHRPELTTGDADVAGLSNQVIRPYTDLLLHDMGPGLADGRPDGEATGTEWRTTPLWGIGLTETVSRHTRFLHDGRARNLTEAVLWHGGEAAAATEGFKALSAAERAALLAFLESL